MRIMHMMLSCFYIDGFNYQENAISRQNLRDGHKVRIVASTETYLDNKSLGYIKPGRYLNSDGIEVVRLPYRKFLPHAIMKKIRAYPNVMEELKSFNPDVIMFHGLASYELLTVSRYAKKNSKVKLYLDSHEEPQNSGTNLLSRYLLHRLFYRTIIRLSLDSVNGIFYISDMNKRFIQKNYKIPEGILEFFPLGGNIIDDSLHEKYREERRRELCLKPEQLLFVHSGKMDLAKRTLELIKAFSSVNSDKLRLILIGSLHDSIKKSVESAILQDARITNLGWKSSEELQQYLCACDLYLQPGSPSATMQNAICAHSAVMLYPLPDHTRYVQGNGFMVRDHYDMARCFQRIVEDSVILIDMRKKSKAISEELLDYRKLANRLYRV